MSSKDKDKTLQEKLKQFFRKSKGNFKSQEEYILTTEQQRDLSSEVPFSTRCKTIRDLSEVVLNKRLEDNTIEFLSFILRDLLEPNVPKDHRQLVFAFFRCLVQGQFHKLGSMMRVFFFQVVRNHDFTEDVTQRLDILLSLTDTGREVKDFEEDIGSFLLEWVPAVTDAGRTEDYMALICNFIKFNAAYIDEDIVAGLVRDTCLICNWLESSKAVLPCLDVLDAIVCYSTLPTDALPAFIGALCRTVNIEEYCQTSWKIMRNLLGTHMGHSALYTMCRLLQEEPPKANSEVPPLDPYLLRGAVFYINMGLWGSKRVPYLKATPTNVLPSMKHALSSKHPVVMYEVILGIQRLVDKFGEELTDLAWDLIFDILNEIISYLENIDVSPSSRQIETHLHETLTLTESLLEKGHLSNSPHRLYALVQRCASTRPESSVLGLIKWLSANIVPISLQWLLHLNELLDHYYRHDTRTNIRVLTLEVLADTIRKYRFNYEDELIEKAVVPALSHVDQETDPIVRNSAAKLLVELCHDCDSKRCSELMDILERILERPYSIPTSPSDTSTPIAPILAESELLDIKTVIKGLINIFIDKSYQLPSYNAIRAYELLVNHLGKHYQRPYILENVSILRYSIIECFLKIRADSQYHLGFPDLKPNGIRFSPYLLVDHGNDDRATSPPITQPTATTAMTSAPLVTYLSLSHACKSVISCLKQEKDWKVLQLVLLELPYVLRNRALILSKHGNDIEYLAAAIIALVADKSLCLPESLRNTLPKLTISDFHNAVFPVVAALASYHAFLEPQLQQRLIKVLEMGMGSHSCAPISVAATMTCALELRETMYKLLPEVLHTLCKISSTKPIANPMLELLSTLTNLPKVYASFVGDQYMSIFAIALPYTNPFKFNAYTVSLAHHVIASWFLKCRLFLRKDCVKFITSGLRTNVLAAKEQQELVNEDSSNRKRSSSLTEQGSRRMRAPAVQPTLDITRTNRDDHLLTFHSELSETCIDLLARYTYSTCSPLPKRLPTADFLLCDGQSMTWIVGHKIITITTSGCSQKALKNGLCDKCLISCRNLSQDDETNRAKRAQKITNNENDSSKDHGLTDFQRITRDKSLEHGYCACWCQGWAEIYVRRPTGNMSWIMRVQNTTNYQNVDSLYQLTDITSLFQPMLSETKSEEATNTTSPPEPVSSKVPRSDPVPVPVRPDKLDASSDIISPEEAGDDTLTKTRNPVRRSNSSPEMSASWKNPFLSRASANNTGGGSGGVNGSSADKDSDSTGKESRVSCEAIPEEISGLGTTPPTNTHFDTHPPLMSYNSFPNGEFGVNQLIPLSPPSASRLHLDLKPNREPKSPPDRSLVSSDTSKNFPSTSTEVSPRADLSTLPPLKRDRLHTISVMSPVRKPPRDWASASSSRQRNEAAPRSGVNPSSIFLQLYHSAYFGSPSERPMLITENESRSLKVLDRMPPYETHKVGVIYAGPGQAGDQTAILRNAFGSVRYAEFLQRLGTLVKLKDVDPANVYLGGLETNGIDGHFAYVWQDVITQVMFHVATLMPNKDTDLNCNDKKRHIGNNFVKIVYNETGEQYKIDTLKSQFNLACVVIQPLDHGTNQVSLETRDEVTDLMGLVEPKIISDSNLGLHARQLALHANLAAQISQTLKQKGQDPYSSNWLERLRKIKQIRSRKLQNKDGGNSGGSSNSNASRPTRSQTGYIDDFTDYTLI